MTKFMRLLLPLLVAVPLAGCTTAVRPEQHMAVQKSPSPRLAVSEQDPLLTCFTRYNWKVEPNESVNIVVTDIKDQTGKATYGDAGTGTLFPINSANIAINSLMLAKGGKSPLKVFNRGKPIMETILNEATVSLRGPHDIQPSYAAYAYYMSGDISGADSIAAAAQQIIVGGYGGGPSQQRYEVSFDASLVDWRTTEVVASLAVKKQYVQQELKLLVADFVGGGGGKSLVTADVEEVKRSLMEGMVRDLLKSASAGLLAKLPIAPDACRAPVQSYLVAAK